MIRNELSAGSSATKNIDASGGSFPALAAQYVSEKPSGVRGPFAYDFDAAMDHWSAYVASNPRDWVGYVSRAKAWRARKVYARAIADYGESVRLEPMSPFAFDERARIWATCSDPKFRDGNKAVESATTACELTDWKDAGRIDTLAAGHAEAGDFAAAVKWQTKAIELETDAKLKEEYRSRLKLYQEKKPYRDANP